MDTPAPPTTAQHSRRPNGLETREAHHLRRPTERLRSANQSRDERVAQRPTGAWMPRLRAVGEVTTARTPDGDAVNFLELPVTNGPAPRPWDGMGEERASGGPHRRRPTGAGGGATSTPRRGRWRAWQLREPELRDVQRDQLQAGRDPGGNADELLAGLWRLARHDGNAGALLLACLGPGTRRIARMYGRTLGRDEATAIALAAIWDRIARFDPPPQRVAQRLLWLAGRNVHRATIRRRAELRHSIPTADHHTLPAAPVGEPTLVLLRHAVAAGIVTPEGAWLTWATRCIGLALAEAGGVLDLGYEATKKRRQRAEAALSAWLGGDHPNDRRTA